MNNRVKADFHTFTVHGEHKAGDFADCNLVDVQAYLDSKNVIYHAGEFGSELPDCQYRFVHLDSDSYQSIKSGLEYFLPRLTPGGKIVVSDYGWHKTPGVARAVHQVMGDHVCKASEYQVVITK